MIYDEAAYLDHFARLCSAETKTVCDITPAYSAIGRGGFEYMKAYFATQDVQLKLFFVMRDPVDRLWSHLRYRDRHDAELDVRHTWTERVKDPEMMAFSDYRATVEALEAVFPAEDLLFLFSEELFSEPAFKELSAFAGVKYMRHIIDTYFDEPELEPSQRHLFALAAYNAGPTRISKLRREAASKGLDPNVWFDNVEVVVARRVGSETVRYVSNIVKYYVAYKLIPEA